MKFKTGKSPCPGIFLKCLLQYNRSISCKGASANWTMNIFSHGMEAIEFKSIFFDKVWNESKIIPTF